MLVDIKYLEHMTLILHQKQWLVINCQAHSGVLILTFKSLIGIPSWDPVAAWAAFAHTGSPPHKSQCGWLLQQAADTLLGYNQDRDWAFIPSFQIKSFWYFQVAWLKQKRKKQSFRWGKTLSFKDFHKCLVGLGFTVFGEENPNHLSLMLGSRTQKATSGSTSREIIPLTGL